MPPDMATRLRVGTAYRDRRESLGLSMADLRERGAPSERVISEFENGKRWPTRRIQTGLAQAVEWSADSIERLERGGAPVVATAPQSTDAALRAILAEIGRLRAEVAELRRER